MNEQEEIKKYIGDDNVESADEKLYENKVARNRIGKLLDGRPQSWLRNELKKRGINVKVPMMSLYINNKSMPPIIILKAMADVWDVALDELIEIR